MKLAQKVLNEVDMSRVGSGATTTGVRDDGMRVVTYHTTPIVQFNDEKIVLDSGGWKSRTTRNRMNQAANEYGLGIRVRQRNGDWFVEIGSETLPFEDGMEIPHSILGTEENDQ